MVMKFLAQVGMAPGPKFAATVTETGFMMLGLGATARGPIMVLGLFVFRMPYDQVAGIVAGTRGNRAILAYANKLALTDRPDLGYVMIFPGMTIVKIVFVDVVLALVKCVSREKFDLDAGSTWPRAEQNRSSRRSGELVPGRHRDMAM